MPSQKLFFAFETFSLPFLNTIKMISCLRLTLGGVEGDP